MRWSWRVGQLAGIPIFVHWTFLILIGWIAVSHMLNGDGLGAAFQGIAFVLALFGCVVLHELGHALAAKRFGIPTVDITLLPIGGLARLERMPEDPRQELWVAIAGPAVNMVIAALLAVLVVALDGIPRSPFRLQFIGSDFFSNLLWVNVMLVVFNLIPAFPMDGGRVLRALLAWSTGDYLRATQTAATIGQGLAILFALLGLFGIGSPMLLFIALFVFLGAQEESRLVQMRTLFDGVPVRHAMMTRFRTLSPADELTVAIDELLAGAQQDFPVVDEGRLVGMLPRHALFKAINDNLRQVRVGDVMLRDCDAVSDTEMLHPILSRMRGGGCSSLPVMRAGALVGLLSTENIGELMVIHSALSRKKPPSGSIDPDTDLI